MQHRGVGYPTPGPEPHTITWTSDTRVLRPHRVACESRGMMRPAQLRLLRVVHLGQRYKMIYIEAGRVRHRHVVVRDTHTPPLSLQPHRGTVRLGSRAPMWLKTSSTGGCWPIAYGTVLDHVWPVVVWLCRPRRRYLHSRSRSRSRSHLPQRAHSKGGNSDAPHKNPPEQRARSAHSHRATGAGLAAAPAQQTAQPGQTCTAADLGKYYIYRDIPGSKKIGRQNKTPAT